MRKKKWQAGAVCIKPEVWRVAYRSPSGVWGLTKEVYTTMHEAQAAADEFAK